MNTKAKRAAALGFGLSFLFVAPPAHGAIDMPDAGQALNAYRYDLPALQPGENIVASMRLVGTYVRTRALVGTVN